ncbi:MAG TPA: sodium/proton-translocating pyrophosphatase, partial [Nocardioides sp.]|nr:sodium/proton-translocating pyrophosphatase [Nocardioides sp.]
TSLALFAVSLAGCGLLTTVGVIVAMDTFGPVSDNAQGVAEMSGDVHGEGAQILTELDAVGNTTKAITKGIAIATAVLAASALFAVALAGCGLLTTVGVIVAMDTFGPVSDNAQGIAEMSGDVSEEGARILTELDAVGNTTKAITKGIAIATAVLAASALFASYTQSAFESFQDAVGDDDGLASLDLLGDFIVYDAKLIVGALLGAGVVFLFSGLAINAVGRAAGAVVMEVRRQFRDIPGIMEGTARPEYGRVVDIVTRDSLRELATPGILAILSPIAVGFGLGVGPLAGFLVGAIATGTLMAVFLANAGGAWDNAKKLVEDGHHGGKGSPAHEATIIGDTVGDPFKDTAGPAINPLLKVMNLVSLLIVGAIISLSYGESENDLVRILIALAAASGIFAAVYISKQRVSSIGDDAPEPVALDKS